MAEEVSRTSGPYDLLIGFAAVFVSSSVAGIFTGVYWRSAGLLIGPMYWGVYLGLLAVAWLVGRRRFTLGMLAALPIAMPAFLGLAALSSFPTPP